MLAFTPSGSLEPSPPRAPVVPDIKAASVSSSPWEVRGRSYEQGMSLASGVEPSLLQLTNVMASSSHQTNAARRICKVLTTNEVRNGQSLASMATSQARCYPLGDVHLHDSASVSALDIGSVRSVR